MSLGKARTSVVIVGRTNADLEGSIGNGRRRGQGWIGLSQRQGTGNHTDLSVPYLYQVDYPHRRTSSIEHGEMEVVLILRVRRCDTYHHYHADRRYWFCWYQEVRRRMGVDG
jgi:hypothetical protein